MKPSGDLQDLPGKAIKNLSLMALRAEDRTPIIFPSGASLKPNLVAITT